MRKKRKYINAYKVKGKIYYFFRKGNIRVPIPHDPDTPEFDQAYWKLRSGRQKATPKTTFSALIDSYYQSPRFLKLKPSTQKEYRRGMEDLRALNGSKDFTKVRRRDVIAARDAVADTWRKANARVENISVLAKQAMDLEWITTNPAQGVEKLKGGSYEAWPEAMLLRYEKHCEENQLLIERTIYELCIGTGQRIGDVCAMRWEQFDDGGYMTVVQEKTGTEVELYCPVRLQKHLARLPRRGDFILVGERTPHLQKRTAQQRVQAVRTAIGAQKFVIHGWRYNAAKELAEAGATDAQIQAVTGHLTLEMAKKYRGQAERKRLSKDAQQLREKAQSDKQSDKPGRKEPNMKK